MLVVFVVFLYLDICEYQVSTFLHSMFFSFRSFGRF